MIRLKFPHKNKRTQKIEKFKDSKISWVLQYVLNKTH